MSFIKGRTDEYREQGVAIVGMTGRFPGASTVEEFWANLVAGVESIRYATEEELRAAGVEAGVIADPDYVRASSTVHEPEFFDAAFFGFSRRDAEIVDPQQRVFLECAWEALEDAACDPDSFVGTIGVFAGAGMNTYAMRNLASRPDIMESAGEYQLMIGNDKDFLSTRVAYKLNLTGPAIGVQTACSTSLVAVQIAFESLLRGECDAALAGGVSVPVPQSPGYMYVPGMILSRDGHCRAFDAEASGTVPGAGAGVVVLKRLADAMADGDHIYAVIKGAAINNDGSSKVGYSAPSVTGQSAVIRKSMEMAGFAPKSVGYVEAHGTGTEVGDPIEFTSLAQVFGSAAERKNSCVLGALKTNIGHLDTASGVAGLIKAALAIKHRVVPPTLHFTNANPLIDFKATTFHVNTALLPYEAEAPFRAGVSSFGIGGTNAHVSLEEAPMMESDVSVGAQLIVVSAKSAAALAQRLALLEKYVDGHPAADLADIAFTLQLGRKPFRHRQAIVADSIAELKAALQPGKPKSIRIENAPDDVANVAFLFPGQGSQYVNMGRGLYESETTFRDVVDRCCEMLKQPLQLDLRTVLYPALDDEAEATRTLGQTAITQPALFVIEYAMAMLWMSFGVVPAAMLGHSVGEYVAACLAGVFSLEDALMLIAERGRLVQSLPGGAMLAVSLAEHDLEPMLSANVSVAAINSPGQTVASGDEAAIEALEAALQKRKIQCRRLRTSHAFHSPMMEPIVEAFVEKVGTIRLRPPTIRFLSNVTGTWIAEEQATDPAYWGSQLRNTVRFAECSKTLTDGTDLALLEVGPGETLLSLMKGNGAAQQGPMAPSMRHPLAAEGDREVWLAAMGRLWLLNTAIDWKAFHVGQRRLKLSLPTYPFQRQRYYLEPGKPKVTKDALIEKQPDIADWFYVPSWRRSAAVALPKQEASRTWLVLSEDGALMDALESGLGNDGRVVQLKTGERFGRISDASYAINPARRADYDHLVRELLSRDLLPSHIVHAFAAALGTVNEQAIDLVLFSTTALIQAMGEGAPGVPVQLDIVCDRAYSVFGEAISTPLASALNAFCKVIPVEYPNVAAHVIDVDLRTNFVRTAHQIVQELGSDGNESVVAYRGTARWLAAWEQVRLPLARQSGETIELRDGGTYVITGGMGGIGLVLGKHLAKSAKATVVLIARTLLPPTSKWSALLEDSGTPVELRGKIEGVQAIEELGGKVVLVEGDVSDAAAMLRSIASIQAEHGVISGIIHAAGILGAGMIATKPRERMQETLAAKVQGTEWVREMLDTQGLDFVMLCSSISAVVPGFGLSDYAASNAYLDGFAVCYDDPQGTRVLSVGWDTWREVGMAVNAQVPKGLDSLREERTRHGLFSQEASEVFDRILGSPMPHIVVSTRPLVPLLELAARGIEEARASGPAADASFHPGTQFTDELTATDDEPEQFIRSIWQELLGLEFVGLEENFFQLGGHSLLGTQVLARLQARFGVNLPLRTIFESVTPSQLAQSVRLASWASSVEAMTPSPEREEIEF
jgi:acyl transferase domain-containing protein